MEELQATIKAIKEHFDTSSSPLAVATNNREYFERLRDIFSRESKIFMQYGEINSFFKNRDVGYRLFDVGENGTLLMAGFVYIDGQGDSAEIKEIFEDLQNISGRSNDLFLIDFSKQNKK